MSTSVSPQEATQTTLLATYAELLESVSHMLALAQDEQWAELIDQRSRYVALVEEVKALDAAVALDAVGRQRKADLLERILEHDVAIRRQLVARREELGKLIGVSQRQRDLHRAYAPQQGSDEAIEDSVTRSR
ncbi:flagellar protein FliT [Halomonas dongshanensis]|uniref:Flagellar protein FliT n=1 Tax=Halomonas dongshanensis TaxID=2890835 RepID=A0ABT2EF94_9GAMM|nr:flagellar protein FliT [Halomonas dongshanensis]MCS2610253.1 flagellar protein FliT [Halomonas dongshanensis]